MRALNLTADERKERIRGQQARYRANNKDKIRKVHRLYYEANAEVIAAKGKAYRARTLEHGRDIDRARYVANRVELVAQRMARHRLKVYGLTDEAFRTLLIQQSGVCAICGQTDGPRQLAVDHDHATGTVRGLLCRACNQALGAFDDDPVRLRKAAAYVERKCDSQTS